MTCKFCGRHAPACPETGYDADDVCRDPACRDQWADEEERRQYHTRRAHPESARLRRALQGGPEL